MAATVTSFAQTAPRTEYSVSLSEKVINLKAGESKQVTVTILKSKTYSSFATKLGVSSDLPAGVTISYEPAEGMFETSTATISAAADAKAGEYQVVLKSTVRNTAKGSIIKVVVGSGVATDAISAN